MVLILSLQHRNLHLFNYNSSFMSFSKIDLTRLSTDIQHLEQLSLELGVNLYIKRDDLNGIGFGGNKVRKLEYLLADAKKQNATHILTLGAIQSNHARLTAITSKMQNFEVELFLKESVAIDNESYQENGNITLNNIVDVKMHRIPNDNKMMARIKSRMQEIEEAGGKAYFIPVGGSNAIGNLGYLDCFKEILRQQGELNMEFDYVVCASGSGGTHAGLMLGQLLTDSKARIKAYNVQPEHNELAEHTLVIINESLSWFDRDAVRIDDVDLNSNYSGAAYGFPEKEHLSTLKSLAQQTGIFLDPVYTAKAFYGLISEIKDGLYPQGANIVFIHTGGSPGIFAYKDWF